MIFACQKFKLFFIAFKDGGVLQVHKGFGQYCICQIVVDDEIPHIPVKGHKEEQTGEIII
jgi:hypothetical protein